MRPCFIQNVVFDVLLQAGEDAVLKHKKFKSANLGTKMQTARRLRTFIIQQIVTLSKYGHDALDICHP